MFTSIRDSNNSGVCAKLWKFRRRRGVQFNLLMGMRDDFSSIGSFQYADDTTIYSSCPARELQRCAEELNSRLNTVSSWSNDSHLALSSKKTKTILLSTSQMSHVHSLDKNRPAITISDSTLEYVNVSKLLGVHFHQHLRACTCLHGVGDPGLVGLVSFVLTLWGTQNKRNLPH